MSNTQLQDIAQCVDDFAQAGQKLAILLSSYDPAHAALISGVLGVVQKLAKTYES